MATWSRVSLNVASKPSVPKESKPYERLQKNNSEYVSVRYHKLVERVVLLEKNLEKAHNPTRFESQLSRVENKLKDNYKKARDAEAAVDELVKSTDKVKKQCEEVLAKYTSKLYDLEERAEDIVRGVTEMRNEMKELYKKTAESSFDSCMIYHNMKQSTFGKDYPGLTFEQKLQFVKDNCM